VRVEAISPSGIGRCFRQPAPVRTRPHTISWANPRR